MKKYSAVLFDFDGTIMDTNDIIIESWQHTYRTVFGREGNVEDIVKTFGEPLPLSMQKCFPADKVELCLDTYRNYQLEHYLEKIHLFDGIEELIKDLHNLGVKMAVVTSRLTFSTVQGLRKYGLEKYFDATITCDDTQEHKPAPAPALAALRKLSASAEESLMIGDSVFDVLCAKNAGIKSVLVGWALSEAGSGVCDNAEPDYRVERAEEILEIVQGYR